ncbi:hypothetical protein ACE38W_09975 [Chitinophaga sp. Hz27]|uniref:hypothetical protein n=1 Tax=Chitinophaga sp. Hz27 TaxID=3347169 RepID=UPI0035D76DC4
MMSLIPNTKGIIKYFVAVLVLGMLSVKSYSQAGCTNWAVTTTVDSSRCFASGTITVTLTGADVSGLSNILYYLEPMGGGSARPGQTSKVLSGLIPDSYKLRVTASCNNNPVSYETTVVVPGNYIGNLNYQLSSGKNALGSCSNGQLIYSITGGRMPYTFRILNAPTSYKRAKQFVIRANSIVLDSLPAGRYVIDVIDSCGTQKDSVISNVGGNSFTVNSVNAVMAQSDCNKAIAPFYTYALSGLGTDYSIKAKFGIGDVWSTEKTYNSVGVTYDTVYLPAGKSLSDYYKAGAYYKRVMTNSCGDVTIDSFKLRLPTTANPTITYNCDPTFNYQLNYYITNAGTYSCFPLLLSLQNKDDNSKVYTNTVPFTYYDGVVSVTNIPFGNYTVTCTTADGTVISTSETSIKPQAKSQFSVAPSISGYPSYGYDQNASFNIMATTGFPAGTSVTMEYPDKYTFADFPTGSASTVINVWYPETRTGYYVLRVSTPCDTTDLPIWITESDVIHYSRSYTAEHTCDGLKVTINGAATVGDVTYPVRFMVDGPGGTQYINGGSTLLFTTQGNYNAYIFLNNGIVSINPLVINYTKSDLNIVKSAGWVCPGAPDDAGRIFVLGQGGESTSYKYKYSLAEVGNYLEGPYLEVKDTGYFVGNSTYKLIKGKTYEVKVTSCNESVKAVVPVTDFDTNQLINGDNTLFCYGDRIRLRVNNLPLTAYAYAWDGPGLTRNVTRYMQQLTINKANYSTGGIYKVTVNSDMCDNPIVATKEVKLAESYPLCYSAVTDTFVNPVRIGMYGNWHPSKTYVYYGQRNGSPVDSLTNIRVDGTYSTFAPFWQKQSGKWQAQYDTAKWVWNAESTIFNLKGYELENKDPLGRYNAGIYGYADALPVAVVQNSRYSDAAYDGFEDYFLNVGSDCADTVCAVGRHFDFSAFQNNIDSTQHHTGRFSMRIEAGKSFGLTAPSLENPPAFSAPTVNYQTNACVGGNVLKDIRVNKDILIPSFTPLTGKQMLFSIWVKEEQPCNCTSYSKTSVMVFVGGPDEVRVAAEAKPTGVIIDGWQRYEQVVRFAKTATSISFSVQAPATTRVFFDDIRFHPYNANMKSFVYDAQSLRLMAELDENNYASFYEYDDDGTLVRVKKETERGVKTISETRSALLKEDGQ